MKSRGILYSAPMVLAKKAGLKTQTRRLLKPQPEQRPLGWGTEENGDESASLRCPYGRPGDQLWTRETWCTRLDLDHIRPRDLDPKYSVTYRADHPGESGSGCAGGFGKWRPSIFLPRWASRFVDEVVEVRVQRLNDISAEDAIAEGVENDGLKPPEFWRRYAPWGPSCTGPRESYRSLWESINGEGSWALNPWVWAITTKPVRP